MQDDYLDLLGDETTLGKPVGGDLREGKATYATLVLFEQGVSEARAILSRHAQKEGDIERMITLVTDCGADRKARARIVTEAETAIAALEVFSASEAKTQLVQLAEQEMERAK